ncbi:MAG: hypothetical protein WD100_13045, partial [Tistlia sp.]
RAWEDRRKEVEAEREAYRRADEADDLSSRVVWAGEAVDLIRESLPASEIVRRTVSEAAAVLSVAPRFVVS